MANRFGGEYRKPHNGASPFSQQAYINNAGNNRKFTPNLEIMPWGGEDEKGTYTQKGSDDTRKYSFEKSKPSRKGEGFKDTTETNPHQYAYATKVKKGDSNNFRDNPPPKDTGGTSVGRNPKPPTKSPSGGMALPLPQKVK